MAAYETECFSVENRFVINSLVDPKCKPLEMQRRMSAVYGEARLSKKNVLK